MKKYQFQVKDCPLCAAKLCEDRPLCRRCFTHLSYNQYHCSCCAVPLGHSEGLLCHECIKIAPSFEKIISPFIYKPPISRLIQQFKYQKKLHYGRLLAELFVKHSPLDNRAITTIIPIPLHPSKLQQRGFNQAGELARFISKIIAVDCRHDILLRLDAKHHQKDSGRKSRLSNMKGAFISKNPVPDKVAIIDDVVTTGATAEAAASCLKQAGAKHVEIWAIARTAKPSQRDL